MDADALKLASRSISWWTAALGGSGYFSRECHERYAALGLGDPVGEWRDVVVPTPTTHHAPRVAALGDVPAGLAQAVFPQMAPRVIAQAVEQVHRIGPANVVEARRHGSVASLRRILGPEPDGLETYAVIMRRACDAVSVGGRPFAASLLTHGWTADPLTDAWHGAEILREARGDAHNTTWLGRGLTAPQIHILTEHWYGLHGCGYRRVWGWNEAELAHADRELVEAGLTDAEGLTERGRLLREEIEDATDTQMLPVMHAIADDLDDLERTTEPISRAVVAGKGIVRPRPSYFTWLASRPAYQFD